MNISVFGIGYVGLVQAAVLAEVGHQVVCMDIDRAKIDKLKRGEVTLYEPGLEELVRSNLAAGRLVFTHEAAEAVAHGAVQFIAVGTPPAADGSADLSAVFAVAETIARLRREPLIGQPVSRDPLLVVNKSTVPVGTGDRVRALIHEVLAEEGRTLHVEVVSNPEFLKEGAAIADCKKPDRIVVGTDSPVARDVMRELYAPFNRNHDRIQCMDLRSAELAKYAANSLLAVKISFINQIAELAEHVGADIEAVRQAIGADPRIGHHFIYPGCGYGGSCFPKDLQALIRTGEENAVELDLLRAVEAINVRQKTKLFERINTYFDGDLRGRTFALWGLAFKPNTDDMRDAPSRVLMEALWAAGAKVRAFDPVAMAEAQRLYGHDERLALMGTPEAALAGADALVICTEWQQFKAPDFDLIARQLNQPLIFDGRNLFDPERMERRGIEYFAIGRGAALGGPQVTRRVDAA
ncbi:UDP-glucose/GDP-mannose dehydrogenase family protein [Pseudomonas sp. HR1]|jgi:UDPglucose 6-dehydrogenase|uniref:UDP-glucose 6-dehydrogenase n=3 Tax=Pseudomonadaceae TaxID=135621 RepID=A0A178LGG8_9PSED|nr:MULTISPECIES: UDP-glucose/GDP-mannose dehydrogenase family protein [Pseudomonas]HCV78560.1 UDP-glucose/GDP-mannose dehydrogenase family protein [Pseudomonas sp.]KTT54958.1 UDP-glucose 6-dehydrogenase [Pseudomonas psychrotolerans]MBA1258113.1 UDP-glucose/GDP-mannose dehydrogenase family protein [Pseudomonas psychrotolerans]MBH3329183.1 UDP-glucose/GDP-mannose dehydrogenase family protein [Pseudomonas oryzihabitans]MDK4198263.1 UDP-glucose/GDP-mannose dehydrogenase family protein [Pseudomonas